VSSSEIPPISSDSSTATNPPQIAPQTEPPIAELPTSEERTLAMLAELLQLFSWVIGPLIIFLVKRESKFVRFHAMQAILWQLVLVLLYIVFGVVIVAGFVAAFAKNGSPPQNPSAFPMVVLLCFYGFMGLVWLATVIISIYFAVKAQTGVWASYPGIGWLAKRIVGV
jgi:uncharacterized Tic20 family protein